MHMFKEAGADDLAITYLEELDCELCRGKLRPRLPRPATVPTFGRRHG